jgi:hypothetical protein
LGGFFGGNGLMWKNALFLVFYILLAGCSKAITDSTSADAIGTLQPSLFHFASINCLAPCWQGITPGITDKATADSIMDGLIHFSSISSNIRFYDGYNEKGYSVELVYSGEKVYLTRIYPSENKPQIGEVIDFLGPPDAVCLLAGTIPDNDPEYETDVLYLKRGIWLSSWLKFDEMDGKGQLMPDLNLTEITFFSPEEKFELLEGNRTAKILKCVRDWEGYVGYKIQSKY